MAIIQIPYLPAVIGLDGSELFEGVQAGTSVKISLAQMIAAIRTGLPTTVPLPVSAGGTGASTLTGYVKGSGTSSFTASSTIPNTDITGLGTMSTQNANSVAITGGSVTGITDLAVADGGTGQGAALTQYGVVYGGSTTAMATTAAGTTTQVLHGNAAGAPTFGAVSLTADVSGTLPAANGGTGQTSAFTQYGVVYGSTTAAMATTAAGTATTVLHGNAAGAPTFGAVSLTSDVSGTLPVANGGTGVTTSTGTTSVVLSNSPALTGQVSFADGTASAPSIAHTGDLNAGIFFPAADTVAITTSGIETMRVTSINRVGINTTAPSYDLEVVGAVGSANYGSGTSFTLRSANGTLAAPTQITAASLLANLDFRGYDNASAFRSVANIRAYSDGAITSTSSPGFLSFWTTPSGSVSTVEAMRIASAGQIGIGGANYGTSGQALVSGGSAAAPSWSSVGTFTTVTASTSVLSTGAGGIGYATGAGVAVTQLTSRTTTTPTTGAKTTGAVTLFTTTAVVGTYFSFTVPNTAIAVTDTVVLSVRGATNTYVASVTAITAATSFQVTMASVVGTASDTPIVNFTIIKGVSA